MSEKPTPLVGAAAPDNVANASKNDKYLAFEWLRAQDCFYAAILGHELSRLKSLENAALAAAEEALRKAEKMSVVCADWHFDEISINGVFVLTTSLTKEFRAALAQIEELRK